MMGSRAPESTAELAVVPAERPPRPKPPAELSDAAAAVWRAVVDSKPATHFDAGSFPLLVAYCRAAVEAETVALLIEGMGVVDSTDRDALRRYGVLSGLADVKAMQLAILASKLRIRAAASSHA